MGAWYQYCPQTIFQQLDGIMEIIRQLSALSYRSETTPVLPSSSGRGPGTLVSLNPHAVAPAASHVYTSYGSGSYRRCCSPEWPSVEPFVLEEL